MLLTLPKPTKSEFLRDFKITHAYSPPPSAPSARYPSPKASNGHDRPLPVSRSPPVKMSTPHRGIGLPPPSAMTLPNPERAPPPPPPQLSQLMDLPPRPQTWQGQESAMRDWLQAKAEEDRRKQAEERTRQEGLKLEQRKIEQSMLRESMQGGVPPHLVPIIFAGIGGGNLTNVSLEWLQQYVAQAQASQQPQAMASAQGSPRETRLLGQPQSGVYGVAPQPSQTVLPSAPVLPGQPIAGAPPHPGAFSATTFGTAQLSPTGRARASTVSAPTSAPRSSTLSKLNTNEMHIPQPPSVVHQAQQAEHTTQSPSTIYFHHWVPPSTQSESKSHAPATPSDYTRSPKKRKAQGGHEAAPPPSSTPQHSSPSVSHHPSVTSTPAGSRRGHARTRSDLSSRGHDTAGRTSSRRSTVSSSGIAETGAPAEAIGSGSSIHEQQHQQSRLGGDERGGQAHPSSSGFGAQSSPTTAAGSHTETLRSTYPQHRAEFERALPPASPRREYRRGGQQ